MRSPVSGLVRFAEGSALGAALLVLFLAAITTADVLIRWLFGNTVPGMSDIALLTVLLITAMCLPVCSIYREHIRITFLGDAMKGPWRRLLDGFAGLVSLGFFGLLAYEAIILAKEYYAFGRVASILPLPMAPFWMVAAFFVVLTAIAEACVTLFASRQSD